MTDKLKSCPFCGAVPTKGLTKKTGCQMHGDPIQYATISCQKCEFKPHCTGGCIYRDGDTPKYKEEAYAEAARKWNTRSTETADTDSSYHGQFIQVKGLEKQYHDWISGNVPVTDDALREAVDKVNEYIEETFVMESPDHPHIIEQYLKTLITHALKGESK